MGGRDWPSRNPWLQAKDWGPRLTPTPPPPIPLPPVLVQHLGARVGLGRGDRPQQAVSGCWLVPFARTETAWGGIRDSVSE